MIKIHNVESAICNLKFPICNTLNVLLVLFSFSLQAQEVWTLDSILVRIRTGNPILQGYERKIEALNAYAEGAKSWMPPMVGAGTFMTPFPGQEPIGQGLMDQGNTSMFMIAAEQAIPNPGILQAKEHYMESKAFIATDGQNHTYNRLQAQAKKGYYQWIVQEKKKTVLEDSHQIMQIMLQLAEIRYPYNHGSLGSIYKAKGRLHEIENMILMADHDIIEKNITLNTLMNIPAGTRFQIDTSLHDFQEVSVVIDTAYLLQNRSDLQQIKHRIESTQLEVELERMERKPEFSIRYEHLLPYNNLMPNQFTLMGMITIPIAPWSSQKYKSNIKGKQLDIEAMKTEQVAILKKAQGMIENLKHHFHIKRQQLENYKVKIIPALQKNYETTMLAYEQNQEQLPLVIDAWEALNMAQMQYLEELGMYYDIMVDYEKELQIKD